MAVLVNDRDRHHVSRHSSAAGPDILGIGLAGLGSRHGSAHPGCSDHCGLPVPGMAVLAAAGCFHAGDSVGCSKIGRRSGSVVTVELDGVGSSTGIVAAAGALVVDCRIGPDPDV